MASKEQIQELEARRAYAEAMGGRESVEKHRGRGKLTIRDRISNLVDDGSFQEVGKLAGTGEYDADGKLLKVTPAPYVSGIGTMNGRPVAVGGEDFTIKGGISWGTMRRKGGQGGFIEDLAHEYRIPLINLIDGAGGSVNSSLKRGYTTFPGVFGFERPVELLGEVPVVGAVLGTAAGGPAGRAILSHWSVMVKDKTEIFAAGPPVVKRSLGQDLTKKELGGTHIAVDMAGTIDNYVDSEEECFEAVKRFLSYLPQNVWNAPPVVDTGDPVDRCEDDLLGIVPDRRTRPYNMHRLVEMVVDKGSIFEIQPTYGKAVITCLARLNGHSVGIIANNPMIYGGAMDSMAARKQTHFVELCDTFHIPLVFLVDLPGFLVGRQAEEAGVLRDGMRAVWMGLSASVPVVTLVIRKCYGMAGMATCNKKALDFKVAWPTAEWGSLPAEGGAAAAFRREIEAAPDPKAKERELEEELRKLASPFRTAEAFGVEEIIDPRETRPFLCRFTDLAAERALSGLGPKPRFGVRP